jgi:hypothetical protein
MGVLIVLVVLALMGMLSLLGKFFPVTRKKIAQALSSARMWWAPLEAAASHRRAMLGVQYKWWEEKDTTIKSSTDLPSPLARDIAEADDNDALPPGAESATSQDAGEEEVQSNNGNSQRDEGDRDIAVTSNAEKRTMHSMLAANLALPGTGVEGRRRSMSGGSALASGTSFDKKLLSPSSKLRSLRHTSFDERESTHAERSDSPTNWHQQQLEQMNMQVQYYTQHTLHTVLTG